MEKIIQQRSENEINLLDLVKVLLKHKTLIVSVVFIVVTITAVISLIVPKTYESKAVIAPMMPADEQSGMNALVAQFGMATPQSSNVVEIVNLLRSDILMQKVMEKGKFYEVLFEKDDLRGKTENEKVWKGIRLLKGKILQVSENKKDGIIIVSAQYKDPVIARNIASTTLTELTDHMTSEAKRVAQANKVYLESQVNATGDPFIRTNVYGLIARQIQTAMLAEAKENYAFKVLDPPRLPDGRIKPRRTQMVGFAFVVSLFVGIFLALVWENLQRNSQDWSEIVEMSGLRRFHRKRSGNKGE